MAKKENKSIRKARSKRVISEKQKKALKDNAAPLFQPGQSGNPAGRPPGIIDRRTLFSKFLDADSKMKDPVTGERMTVLEELAYKMIKKAVKGDGSLPAQEMVLDNRFGKLTQKLAGDDTLPPIGVTIIDDIK